MRDVFDAMVVHLGGSDVVTEPERMTARRAAVLECELIHIEDALARIRAEGGEPDAGQLDLYSRLSNSQRRHLEVLGWAKRPRDITPSLSQYLANRSAEEESA